MIGKICGGICVFSFIFSCVNGTLGEVGNAIIDGSSKAVTLTISLMGMMCLWNGVMQVAKAGGVTEKMSRLMSPVLKFLFPDAYKKKNGMGEISASITANIFGLGNASTPLAIKAMEKLQENNTDSQTATNDMVMFTVLGCTSFDIFPTTLIALRKAAESKSPFEIIVPVWICSLCTAVVAVLLAKALCCIKSKKTE